MAANPENDQNTAVFIPRVYQNEIFEKALQQNTIALLGTGTGKTYIAVMLIKHLAHQIEKPYVEGGKRTFFLVPTVPLVIQQADAIRRHSELKIETYHGSKGVDNWSAQVWQTEFEKNQVLVMTAEVFKNILNHGFITLTDVNLIIFDECHSAVKNHPYREIMKVFTSYQKENLPRILGLTASLINGKCKIERIEDEIKKLENTLNSSVVTASDLILLKECGTDPTQSIDMFSDYNLSIHATLEEIDRILDRAINALSSLNVGFKLSDEDEEDTFFSTPKKCMGHIKNVLNSLGPICTLIVCKIFLKEVNNLIDRSNDADDLKALNTTAKIIDCIESILDKITSSMADPFFLAPNKLSLLLHILLKNKDGIYDEDGKTNSMCCIIFVQQRITAFTINKWLSLVKDNLPTYNFINSEYIVGHGMLASSFMRTVSMNISKQDKVLKEFRFKTYNILVATSVIEEGMDVPKCNLVIRFDPPKDFRAYIQSKGRARAKNSFYKLMISSKEMSNFGEDILLFENIHQVLLKVCKDRESPDEDEVVESLQDYIIPPYIPNAIDGGPRITLTSATSLIYRYCSLLPSDRATVLLPKWKLHKQKSLDNKTVLKYCYTLFFPINSCIKEPTKGPYMKSKKLAKMATALEACKTLHKIGELDDHLIPLGDKLNDEDKEAIGLDTSITYDPSDGQKKRKRFYTKKIADSLLQKRSKLETPCYLYKIHLTKENDLLFYKDDFKPELSSRSLGILSINKIPQVPTFFVYTPGGKIKVELNLINSSTFPESDELLEEFNEKLFSLISKKIIYIFSNTKESETEFNIHCIPLKKDEPDWDLVDLFLKDKTPLILPLNFYFDESNYRDTAIIPFHKPYSLFYVKEIHKNLGPHSTFSSKDFKTFSEYYEKKYELVSPRVVEQNLIECKQLYSCNMIKRSKKNSKPKQKHNKELYIPEFCTIHPLPASLLKQITCLPTILYRLNSLLLASELQKQITDSKYEYKISDFNLSLDFNSLLEKSGALTYPNLDNDVRVAFDYHPKLANPFEISPVLILNALTTTSAADDFNLERLETIGDSFLKFTISLLVYKKFMKDEGKLTMLRSSLICNKYLFHLANKKGLPQYLQNMMFEANSNWLPPLHIKDDEQKIDGQDISDKTVADSVEALIGAYLLGAGPVGALNFMSWIGFKIEKSSEDLRKLLKFPKFSWLTMPDIEIYQYDECDFERNRDELYLGLDRLEEKISYKFKNKTYLIQALTHPSYSFNRLTGCYQRLEFLGDSILDYIITCYIFKDPQELSPGQLTDLRSSLVNNSFFAFLSITNGFHKHLKCLSPSIFNGIGECVKLWSFPPSTTSEKMLEKYLQIEEQTDFIFEIPKALGDIFESLAGAIYLDSGMSLDTVWRIFFPIMKSALDKFSKEIPKHPVRVILEAFPNADFEYCEKSKSVTLSIPNFGTFNGSGNNKIVAKLNAAKKAISQIRKTTGL